MSEVTSEPIHAAVFAVPARPLELRSFARPELAEGEVLVRVTMCTICGSDLHTWAGRRPAATPTVLGHEVVGRIAELGPGAPVRDAHGQPLTVGQRVTWSLAVSCGTCFFCEQGLPQKCKQLFKYGHQRIVQERALSGGLAEYCHLMPGTAIVPLPDSVPDHVACPASCATATVAAALRVGELRGGEVVLIHGAGLLGLSAAAMARTRGAREVIVVDRLPERVALAERYGATHAVAEEDQRELLEQIEECSEGEGVDLALELSGSGTALLGQLDALRVGGRCVLVGSVFPSDPVPIAPEQIVRRMLSIHGLHNYAPVDLLNAVEFLATHHGEFPFASAVSAVFPLGAVDEAFRHAVRTRALRVAVGEVAPPAEPG